MLKETYLLGNACVFFLPKKNKKLLLGKGIIPLYILILCWIFSVSVHRKLESILIFLKNDLHFKAINNFKTYHFKYSIRLQPLVQYIHSAIDLRVLKKMFTCFLFSVTIYRNGDIIMTPVLYTLYSLAIFLLIFWSGKWVIHLLAIIYAKYRLHRKTQLQPNEKGYSGVTILKPLMGTDPHLSSNLETFFTMNYPLYEIHFCIEDENDPAVEVARKLQERFPNVTSRIFTGGTNVGVNPKINNMHSGYKNANHPFILISDSGIRMKEDTLLDMVNHMEDDVGLVHQMPFTCDRGGFAGTLEKVYFGTAQARIYLAADFLGINCHTGMSALVRKSLIDEGGGIEAFSCYLAEDFFLAKSLTDRGWKMRVSSQPAWQNSGICEVSFFQARLRRWVKLRVAMLPLTLLFEPLSECLVLGAATSWAVNFLFNWDPILFYLVHILVWFFCDWVLLSVVQNGTLPFNKVDFVISWIFREACSPYIFIKALLNPKIRWRTRTYKLKWGGIAEECKV